MLMEEVEQPGKSDEAPPDSVRPEWDAGESLALAAAELRSLGVNCAKPRVRILGVPLPMTGISWIGSIVIHMALIVAGTAVYLHFRPPPKLGLALGDGGAHPVGMMWRESTPGGVGLPDPGDGDSAQPPPANSMTAVMNQLENQQPPDAQMKSMASAYLAPQLIWGAPPTIGTGHNGSNLWGTPVVHRGNGPPRSDPTPPPAHQGEGTGRGTSVGAGRGDVNGGQAGVPTGTPDPTLPAPVYPEESRRRGEEGLVKLSIKIARDGSVGSVEVVSEPPYPRLTRAAIDAVKQAHFDRAYGGLTRIVPYDFVLH